MGKMPFALPVVWGWSGGQVYVTDAGRKTVCVLFPNSTFDWSPEEGAHAIALALNSFEPMRKALEAADQWFSANYPSIPGGLDNPTWKQVTAALPAQARPVGEGNRE